MSSDTGGFVLTPPARNYSPWYQWMARLAATVHEDPLPERQPSEIPAWVERLRTRLTELLGPEPESVPLDLETLESMQCDGYRRDKIVFDTEDTMSVPAYLLVPEGREDVPPGAAVLACHGHGPGKSQAVGLDHTDMPNADYALQLARELRGTRTRSSLLRRAARLEPRRPLHVRHESRPCRHGGLEPSRAERVGSAPLPRRARAAPAGRSHPHGHGRHLLWRYRHVVHGHGRHYTWRHRW